MNVKYFIKESSRINSDINFFDCYGFYPFDGIDGCKRLAYNFAKFVKLNNIEVDLHGTYSEVCCIFYNLKPPVDNKKWLHFLKLGGLKWENFQLDFMLRLKYSLQY